jgi:hypothetical protein
MGGTMSSLLDVLRRHAKTARDGETSEISEIAAPQRPEARVLSHNSLVSPPQTIQVGGQDAADKASTVGNTLTSDDWRDLYEERSAIRQYDGHYTRAEAERLAWGELENRWNLEHSERVSRDLCAGCRRPIESASALDLIDGSRVHLNGGNACLIRHGKRWRATATRALMALGLRPPVGVDQ